MVNVVSVNVFVLYKYCKRQVRDTCVCVCVCRSVSTIKSYTITCIRTFPNSKSRHALSLYSTLENIFKENVWITVWVVCYVCVPMCICAAAGKTFVCVCVRQQRARDIDTHSTKTFPRYTQQTYTIKQKFLKTTRSHFKSVLYIFVYSNSNSAAASVH